jgi:O-antigen ligase
MLITPKKQALLKEFSGLSFSNRSHILISLAIFSFPLIFLSVRHGAHFVLFFLLLMTIVDLIISQNSCISQLKNKSIALIALSMSAIFFATLVTQILQGSIILRAYDGPSKILCAAVVFLYLIKNNISYIKILELAIPISSLIVLATLLLNPDTSQFWGGRLASKFVDPNSMGSQTSILGLLCLLSIRNIKNERWILLMAKLMGCLIYLYIATFAGSRGGWLTVIPVMTIWVLFQLNTPAATTADAKRKHLAIIIILTFVSLAVLALYTFQPFFAQRVDSGYMEITNWFSEQRTTTSAGIRLSMWEISLSIIQNSPFWGLGTSTPIDLLNNSTFNVPENYQAIQDFSTGGPHSDILAKLLAGGLIGLGAYLITLFIPGYIFWAKRNDQNMDTRLAARIGCYYITGLFFCGLANEMFSMKYLNTFFGLMIACLAAQVLNSNKLTSSIPNVLNHESK